MQSEAPEPSIHGQGQYLSAIRALSRKQGPQRFLRLLMNAVESYRQARKMGWSRPQNKKGLTVFQSFLVDTTQDRAWVDEAYRATLAEFPELDPDALDFLHALQADPKLMAFVFVHDMVEGDRRFEGLTFSLGRRSALNARFRDRFDLILESEILHGAAQGFSRIRAFVDPYRRPIRQHPARSYVHDAPCSAEATQLFEKAGELYTAWLPDPSRHWAHWTTEYIDYFGPRHAAVQATRFPTAVDHAP